MALLPLGGQVAENTEFHCLWAVLAQGVDRKRIASELKAGVGTIYRFAGHGSRPMKGFRNLAFPT